MNAISNKMIYGGTFAAHPPMPMMDLGVRIPKGSAGPTPLSEEDVVRMLGREESARLNFVGLMIEGAAMQMVSEWIDDCRRLGRKEYRKYTRPMQEAINGYAWSVMDYWKDNIGVYKYFLDEIMKESVQQREIHYRMGMANEVYHQLPKTADRDSALVLSFTILMLRRAEEVEREKLAKLSEAAGGKIAIRYYDPNVRKMIRACEDMQRDLQIKVTPTHGIMSVIGSFYNKFNTYCVRLLSEEAERERSNAV